MSLPEFNMRFQLSELLKSYRYLSWLQFWYRILFFLFPHLQAELLWRDSNTIMTVDTPITYVGSTIKRQDFKRGVITAGDICLISRPMVIHQPSQGRRVNLDLNVFFNPFFKFFSLFFTSASLSVSFSTLVQPFGKTQAMQLSLCAAQFDVTVP